MGAPLSLQVVSLAAAFSSFKKDSAYKTLEMGKEFVEENDTIFGSPVYDAATPLSSSLCDCVGLKTQGDLMGFVGKELALRCLKTRFIQNEASKRELISPILFAAAALAGECSRCDSCNALRGTAEPA